MRCRWLLALALAVTILTLGSALPSFGGPPAALAGRTSLSSPAPLHLAGTLTRPCGRLASTTYRHVVWIWFENHSRSQVIGSPGSTPAKTMPTLNRLARACGESAGARAVSHPSLPNYLAGATGTITGLDHTCIPAACPQTGPSIFSAADAQHLTWRVYAEAMTTPCQTVGSGTYAPRHNPAVYFPALTTSCRGRDLPLGTPASGDLSRRLRSGGLPAFTWIVPDLCHSAHDCSLATADGWLTGWIATLLNSPDYRAGNTAIMIGWDEGGGGVAGQDCRVHDDASCDVSTVIVSPTTRPGTQTTVHADHLALLRTTEELLTLPLIGTTSHSLSLKARFNLG